MNKEFKTRYLYSVALFLSLLIITIPLYTSNVMAVVDEKTDFSDAKLRRKTEATNLLLENDLAGITGMNTAGATANDISSIDPAQACIEKNEKNNIWIELMDNDIISTLENIVRVMQAIDSIWISLKSIKMTLSLFLQDFPPTFPEGSAVQKGVNAIDKAMKIINIIVGCGWGKLCQVNIGGASIGPYDNIYTAIACICPTAVLINMRKLSLIYKTYNCCIEQSCTNGMSIEHCNKELEIQECMNFGKGAFAKMFVSVIIGILGSLIAEYVLVPLMKQIPPWLGPAFAIAGMYFEVKNIMQAIEDLGETFSDPDCTDLNFGKLKEDAEDDFVENLPEEENLKVTLIDTNGDGIGDTLVYTDSSGNVVKTEKKE